MATFHFDLVSPEKLLFSGEVNQVDVPGSEGDFGVLAGHAPLITTLRPGILVIYGERGALRIVVDGGFAEVGPGGLTVLAEMARSAATVLGGVLAGGVAHVQSAGRFGGMLILERDAERQVIATPGDEGEVARDVVRLLEAPDGDAFVDSDVWVALEDWNRGGGRFVG